MSGLLTAPMEQEAFTNVQPSSSSPSSLQTEESPLPDRAGLKKCLAIFLRKHFSDSFCSFLPVDDLDTLPSQSFLMTVIVCLCSRYLSSEEALGSFGLASAENVYAQFVPKARAMASTSFHNPSGAFVCLFYSPYL